MCSVFTSVLVRTPLSVLLQVFDTERYLAGATDEGLAPVDVSGLGFADGITWVVTESARALTVTS